MAAHAGLPASPLLWAPGDPALQMPDLGLAERLKQSWVQRSTYQAVGKGVSSPSPATAPWPPCAPFDLRTRSREREGKEALAAPPWVGCREQPTSPIHTWGCLLPFVHEIESKHCNTIHKLPQNAQNKQKLRSLFLQLLILFHVFVSTLLQNPWK